MNERLGKVLYGVLFAVVLPVLLVLWARAAAPNVALPAVVSPLGWGAAAAGLGLLLWAMAALAVWGRGLPMNAYPPAALVTRGPYALVGHPIYLGFVLVCAGCAVGTGSAAGLWLVTPVVALGVAALVLGYEGPDLDARFGARPRPAWSVPPAGSGPPARSDRTAAFALVLLPWAVLYEGVQALGVAPDAVALLLPGEAAWPVWEWTEIVYASTYLFVALAPLAAATRSDLRRFMVRGWAATALVVFLWLVLPVAAPPRPFDPQGPLGALLALERRLDSPACAFPSFHVVWAFLAAPVWAGRLGRARGLAWAWAAAIALSCLSTGMHTVADVAGGLAVALLVLRLPAVWEALRAGAERLANSWREWDFGAVRVINHGGWAALGTFAGVGLAGTLAGPRHVGPVLFVACAGLAGAGLWAQFVEGSPRLLRPYGYYGGVLGVVAGCLLARAAFGTDAWLLLAAYAVAAPWIQAAGRVRCLVQGCCHGAPAPPSVGIRYRHARSRVCRLSGLGGVPVHPTPLYSILWNVVPALIGARLWAAGAPLPVIVGAYLILAGLGRFVEESRRGEPQTPVFARLRLYQWMAAGTVAAGAAVTCVTAGTPAPAPVPSSAALAAAFAFAAATWFALGVDFPRSSRRFARLVVLLLAATLAASAAAEEKRKAPPPPAPVAMNWEVTLGGAGGFGVSSSDMDAAFGASGYVAASSGDFLSATFFPAVRFSFGERAAVGLSFSSTKLGSTTGSGSGTTISIQRSSMDVALVGFWRPLPGVRVGAGPAWYRLTASPEGGTDLNVSKIGWIAEAGIAFPEGGRFYADFAAQWRGTGSADFGTYAPPAKGPLAPAPVSLDGIGCAHAAFLAGLGFRF